MLNNNEITNFLEYYKNDGKEYNKMLVWTLIHTEYIQIKILEYIFQKEYWKKLILIWWSSIRLLRDWNRPSNDLDFDSEWISNNDFEEICFDIKNLLENLWYKVTLINKNNEVNSENIIYHKTFKVENDFEISWYTIKFNSNIHINIKIDLKDSEWNYNKEWISAIKSISWTKIQTARIDSLLSKKIIWFLSRSHEYSIAKDLFDIIFLLEFTEPDYNFLYEYEWIENSYMLFQRIQWKYDRINYNSLINSNDNLNQNIFNHNYYDIALDAISIIKHQLESYKNN